MTADPYMDAINAGAAALAKPYRDPDTVEAFVEAFPTIAAARVIEAALPLLRATILTEQAAPGPCPAVTEFGHQGPFFDGDAEPRLLRALCDLRAGHVGQHEAQDEQWGHFRWSDPVATGEAVQHTCASGTLAGSIRTVDGSWINCERTPGHPGWHIAGTRVWDGQGETVLT